MAPSGGCPPHDPLKGRNLAQEVVAGAVRLESTCLSTRGLAPAAGEQLCDFEFTFLRSLRRGQIESLRDGVSPNHRENVTLVGPGMGKTHVAISLAIAAAQCGGGSTSARSPT